MQATQIDAQLIADRFFQHYDIFTGNIREGEMEEMAVIKEAKDTTNSRIKAIKFGEWKMGDRGHIDLKSWECRAFIKDQAARRQITEGEVTVEVVKATGQKRAWVSKEVKNYKRWKANPVDMINDMLYVRTQDISVDPGDRKRKRGVLKAGGLIKFLEQEGKDKPVLGEMISQVTKKAKQMMQDAMNSPPQGHPDRGNGFPSVNPAAAGGDTGN